MRITLHRSFSRKHRSRSERASRSQSQDNFSAQATPSHSEHQRGSASERYLFSESKLVDYINSKWTR